MPRLYVMNESDAMATGALTLLGELGAECYTLEDNDSCLPVSRMDYEIILLFQGDGRFPSKHLRVLPSITDLDSQGFMLSDALQAVKDEGVSSLVAIKPLSNQVRPGLSEALRQLHFRDRDGSWKGFKRKRPSRRNAQETKREERRLTYLPM